MPEIIEKLERRYGDFINEPKSWDFFIGVALYVHYIQQTPVLKDLINQALKQKAEDLEPIEKLSKEALIEIGAAEDKLFNRLKEKKISYPELESLIEKHEGIKKGTHGGNAPIDDQLYDSLAEIIRELYFHDEGKYRQALSGLDLIFDWPKQPAIEKFRFANALDEKYYEMRILEDKKDVAIWAAWEYLHDAYLVFYKGRSHVKGREARIKERGAQISPADMKERWEDLNFGVQLLEREEVKSGKNSHAFFDMDFFRPFAKSVHNYLLEELEKLDAAPTTTKGQTASHHKVMSIYVIEPKSNEKFFTIMVNNDLSMNFKVSDTSAIWAVIVKLAKNEVAYESDYPSAKNTLNSVKDCKIYTSTGLAPTAILKVEDGRLLANIPIEFKSQKWFSTQKAKVDN